MKKFDLIKRKTSIASTSSPLPSNKTMSIAGAVSLSQQIKLLNLRLDKQESHTKSSRQQLRQHAELLSDSASIIELEASSLIKADRSQIHSLVSRSRDLEKQIKKKLDMSALNLELEKLKANQTCGLKTLQAQFNQLKSKFHGAVEELVLEFGGNIKKDLNNCPTKKELEMTVTEIFQRLETVEQAVAGGSKSRQGRRRNNDSSDSPDLNNKSEKKSKANNMEDFTDQLRFDDLENSEDEEDNVSSGETVSVTNLQRELTETRHQMFLDLQNQVLRNTRKNHAQGLMCDRLSRSMDELLNWKKETVDPMLIKMTAVVAELNNQEAREGSSARHQKVSRARDAEIKERVNSLEEQMSSLNLRSMG